MPRTEQNAPVLWPKVLHHAVPSGGTGMGCSTEQRALLPVAEHATDPAASWNAEQGPPPSHWIVQRPPGPLAEHPGIHLSDEPVADPFRVS